MTAEASSGRPSRSSVRRKQAADLSNQMDALTKAKEAFKKSSKGKALAREKERKKRQKPVLFFLS